MLTSIRKHLEAIKPNVSSGKITLGGATLDEQPREGQPMKINGSAMLVSADSKEDVMKLVESDVYYESRVWDPSKVSTLHLVFPHNLLIECTLVLLRFKSSLSSLRCELLYSLRIQSTCIDYAMFYRDKISIAGCT